MLNLLVVSTILKLVIAFFFKFLAFPTYNTSPLSFNIRYTPGRSDTTVSFCCNIETPFCSLIRLFYPFFGINQGSFIIFLIFFLTRRFFLAYSKGYEVVFCGIIRGIYNTDIGAGRGGVAGCRYA